MNKLINIYFSQERGEDIEIKIAGSAHERGLLMPILYLDKEDKH